jgi:hypothetical protein
VTGAVCALGFALMLTVATAGAGMRGGGPAPTAGNAELDWQRRSTAPGVVIAVGFDDIREWAKYSFDTSGCNPAYQVELDGRTAGCRANAFDTAQHASGAGSVRFDIPSRSGQGVGGNIAIPFGDYARNQFGENSEFWVSWRQRMTPYFIEHRYAAIGGGTTAFKQVILAQGDMEPGITGYACSENQIVVVSSRKASRYPTSYMECVRYVPFAEGRRLAYRPDQWTTYTMHVRTGPVGSAVSSSTRKLQPGFVDSLYELYVAYEGEDYQLAQRQEHLVIPRGQYYVGGDPNLKSSYKPKSGFVPNDGHPLARFGKLWLLPYMTNKSKDEDTQPASTWYDEVIVSRCPIAAPGFDAGGACERSGAP